MQRISLSYLARFGEGTDFLAQLPIQDTSMTEIGPRLVIAQQWIILLHITGSYYAPHLRASIQAATLLLEAISNATGNPIEPNKQIQASQIAAIKVAFDNYKPVVYGELGAIDAYLVTRKGAHDTLSLLDQGDQSRRAFHGVMQPLPHDHLLPFFRDQQSRPGRGGPISSDHGFDPTTARNAWSLDQSDPRMCRSRVKLRFNYFPAGCSRD